MAEPVSVSTLAKRLRQLSREMTEGDPKIASMLILAAKALEAAPKVTAEMVNRFLSWKLPASVRPDSCVLDQGYPHRIGTNLLTADETRQMLEHVLAAAPTSPQDAGGRADAITVAGSVSRSPAALIRAAKLCIADEQEKPLPDNALVSVLCDTVRLAEEMAPPSEARREGEKDAERYSPDDTHEERISKMCRNGTITSP